MWILGFKGLGATLRVPAELYVPEMQLVKSLNLTDPITNLDMIKSFLVVILMVCCAKQKELQVDLHVSTAMEELY